MLVCSLHQVVKTSIRLKYSIQVVFCDIFVVTFFFLLFRHGYGQSCITIFYYFFVNMEFFLTVSSISAVVIMFVSLSLCMLSSPHVLSYDVWLQAQLTPVSPVHTYTPSVAVRVQDQAVTAKGNASLGCMRPRVNLALRPVLSACP